MPLNDIGRKTDLTQDDTDSEDEGQGADSAHPFDNKDLPPEHWKT
jgi:hypothetical protein